MRAPGVAVHDGIVTKLRRIVRPAVAAVVLVTGLAILPASASSAPTQELVRSDLRAALAAVTAAGAPGAFAQVREGEQVWAGASGIADLSTASPMRPWMRQRVGSITKTFVATTVLQLVGEGRLGLDDPIGSWLADLVPPQLGEQVTVRMLLNHTSGIGNYTDALLDSFASLDEARTTTYTPQQLVAMGLALPPTGPPGAAFSYSNTNYILAGLLIQRVTGQDPAAEITTRIIRPLWLGDTYFPGTDPAIRGPHPGAYFAPLGVRDFSEFNMSWAWMAGELVSTTDDLNDFYRALLDGHLLPPALLAQMRTTVPFDPAQPEAGGYGLGIYTVATPCGSVWGHGGGVTGQITVSMHLPDVHRQSSFAVNLSHYQLFILEEQHPIDIAWTQFIVTALCPGSTTAGAPPTMLPTPDISAMDQLRG
jgi:D-alanyl-D-alanine carboxypeptidase